MTTPQTPAAQDDYAASAQPLSLAVIDAAIMLAAREGDAERRDKLMGLRVAAVLTGFLATLGVPGDAS